ncbi:MAG: sulfatase-like hydrolase/transferase, partial [Acidimicrobiia bacterium]|nr:sulfatase-like hydrolase/transferase [Acidimicrobiia bacterium]
MPLVCLLLVGACGSSSSTTSTPELPPNFVVVLIDDLDQTTSPYWDALPETRSLVTDQGLTFAQAFAPAPVCCPARATSLSGRLSHNTGVYDN